MDDALLLQKYHGLGNDYLVLDPNKNKIHLLERHIVENDIRHRARIGSNHIPVIIYCEAVQKKYWCRS